MRNCSKILTIHTSDRLPIVQSDKLFLLSNFLLTCFFLSQGLEKLLKYITCIFTSTIKIEKKNRGRRRVLPTYSSYVTMALDFQNLCTSLGNEYAAQFFLIVYFLQTFRSNKFAANNLQLCTKHHKLFHFFFFVLFTKLTKKMHKSALTKN